MALFGHTKMSFLQLNVVMLVNQNVFCCFYNKQFWYCVGHHLMSIIKSGSWSTTNTGLVLFPPLLFVYSFGFILAYNLKWSRSAEMNVLFLGLYMNSLIVCLCIVFFFLNSGIVLYECNYRTDIFFLLYSSFDQRPFQRPLTSRVKLSPFVEQYGVFPISFTLFFSSHLLFFSHPSFLSLLHFW